MTQRLKDFRRSYRKNYLENPDFSASDTIRTKEDIPVDDDTFKNTTYYAYLFLINCSSQDMAHLKILPEYGRILKRNENEIKKNLNPTKFATILFILHHYSVRMHRSPWRKDFFTIKTYNGFYQYNLRKWLAPVVIEELLGMLGFVYDSKLDSFICLNFNSSTLHNIKEAGMGFFLSYVHCMIKYDSQFKKNIVSKSPRSLHSPITSSTLPTQSILPPRSSLERAGTSGVQRNSAREILPQTLSSARDRRREKPAKNPDDIETKHLYGNSHKAATGSSNYLDLYRPQEEPIDLTKKTDLPYEYKNNRNPIARQISRGSPHSDYDDHALYGGLDAKMDSGSVTYNGSHEAAHSLDNSLTDRVLYPPNTVRGSSGYVIDTQLENCRFEDPIFDRATKSNSDKDNNDHYIANNYVEVTKLNGRRGSPDGEITRVGYRDHVTNGQQYRTPYKTPPSLLKNGNEHVYHEIKDGDIYGP